MPKRIFLKNIKVFLVIAIVAFTFFISEEARAGAVYNLSGWAWSENIGWISFNNENVGGSITYRVKIDYSSGIFSGYAWSENIGWISFNKVELTGCPSAPCQAELNFLTNEVSGWARVLSYGGGWEGWIRLRDTNYGVSWNESTNELEGWAWSDQTIGWISFNCNNEGVCGTSNYKVTTTLVPVDSTVSKLYVGEEQNYPIEVDVGEEYTFQSDIISDIEITGCDLRVNGEYIGSMNVPPGCTNCVASIVYQFNDVGTYNNSYANCEYIIGGTIAGEPVTIIVGGEGAPIITDGPTATTVPPGGGISGIDYCASPTTQSGCDVYFEVTATDPDNDPLTYSWDFDDGDDSDEEDPSHHFNSVDNYSVEVSVNDGTETTRGGLEVVVIDPTLSVSLTADPSFGPRPMNDVDLRAIVSGSIFGTINYKFDCTNNGTWEHEVSNQTTEDYTVTDLCDYSSNGTYTAKVLIQRGLEDTEDTVEIIVDRYCWWWEETTCTSSQGCTHTIACNIIVWPPCPTDECVINDTQDCGSCGTKTCNDSCTWDSCVGEEGCFPELDCPECPCPIDFCLDDDYYDYPEYGDCTSSCVCDVGTPCEPTIEYDDERCASAGENNPPQATISCDATGCSPGASCSGTWIAYNGNCQFDLLNQSTDIDSTNPENNNDIIKSVWSIFYQGGGEWQDPYLTCLDDPGTIDENEAICDLTLPSLSAEGYYAQLYVEDTEELGATTTNAFYVRQEAIADFDCSLDEEEWQNCDDFRVSEDELVYFKDKSSVSEGAVDIVAWSWTLEDGDPPSSTSSSTSASFTEVDAGSGVVELEVTDNIGRQDKVSYQVLVTFPLPKWREVSPL